jgi:branched-chain amino acid transport system substrate-binding protein
MARRLHGPARLGAAVAFLGLTSLVAGCGSSGGSSAPADSPKGAIKIMDITTVTGGAPLPENPIAVTAIVERLNKDGGINGRKVELKICDDKYDPNVAVACAREAKAEGYVAMVGGDTTFDGVFETLDREGIAAIWGLGTAATEQTASTSFPISGAAPGYSYGAADLLTKVGVKKPVFFGCDNAACSRAGGFFTQALDQRGVKARTVTAPPSQPDYAAAAAKAIQNGTDGVFIASYPADLPKIVKALKQVGYKGAIVTYATLAPQSTIKAMGEDAEGLHLVGNLLSPADKANPAIQQFVKDVDASQSKLPGEEMGDIGVSGYASVEFFAKLVDGMNSITSKTVLNALQNLKDPIDVGLTSPYSVVGKKSPLDGSPRLFNPTVVYSVVKDRVITTDGHFVNPFAS